MDGSNICSPTLFPRVNVSLRCTLLARFQRGLPILAVLSALVPRSWLLQVLLISRETRSSLLQRDKHHDKSVFRPRTN